jgi:hypothetical protein
MTMTDFTKERLAYLRLWLGIYVALFASLFGWAVRTYPQARPLPILAGVLGGVVAFMAAVVNRRIVAALAALKEI